MSYAIMRIAKLKTNANISSVEKHMDRTRKTPNADPEKTQKNIDLIQNQNALERFDQLTKDIKIRSNAVRGLDIFLGASPEFFQKDMNQDKFKTWVDDNKKWLNDTFGKDNILRAKLHLDESTPHIQAIVVPRVFDEKKQKYKLSAKHYIDGRQKLSDLQTNYHQAVEKNGLERGIEGSKAVHKDIKDFYNALNQAKDEKVPKPKLLESKKKYQERVQERYTNMSYRQLDSEMRAEKGERVLNTIDDYKRRFLREYERNMATDKKVKRLTKEIKRVNELLKINPKAKEELAKANEIYKENEKQVKQKTKKIAKLHQKNIGLER